MPLKREDLRKQLQAKTIAPVYLLFGAETFLRDLAAKTIADIALRDSQLREFNETAFSLNIEGNLKKALAAAEQLPMMSPRRVLRITDIRISQSGIRDTIKESDEPILTAYLSRPAETSVVIFVADELNRVRKSSKLLEKNSVAVEFDRLDENELLGWTRAKIKDGGAEADENAIRLIVALVGNDVRRLTNEINKLITAALPGNVITYELVESLVPNSRELSNFELTGHLLGKNKTGAMEVLKKILDDGAEPLMILGLISYNFRRLFMAKDMMSQGLERNEVAKILGVRYRSQEDILATARRTDAAHLARAISRIAETDLAIKTSRGGGAPRGSRMQIEMLVCELVGG